LKNIVVTGSDGFIGKNLILKLNSMGHRILGIDQEYLNKPNWELNLNKILDNFIPNVVFHVGACSNTLETNVQHVMERNYQSSKVIVKWTSKNNAKMIFSSSAANYGVNGNYPANLYGWSKYVAEDYVINNEGVALRYFNVYGPGEDHKKNMASFMFQAFKNNQAGVENKIFPKNPSRDFVYIADVVSSNIYADELYDKLQGQIFEVSTGVSTTFEKLMNEFGLQFAYTDERAIPAGYQFYTCGDKKRWMPGWQPEFSIEQGIFEYKKYLENKYSNA
jgi:ADP-L-glycero-D-manno-heptose 6-epimerase